MKAGQGRSPLSGQLIIDLPFDIDPLIQTNGEAFQGASRFEWDTLTRAVGRDRGGNMEYIAWLTKCSHMMVWWSYDVLSWSIAKKDLLAHSVRSPKWTDMKEREREVN